MLSDPINNTEYTTLLFYHYTSIDDVKITIDQQLSLCQSLQLHGRVRISSEGFNATLDGLNHDIRMYIDIMEKNVKYNGIHWKLGKTILLHRMPSLSIKEAKEVVSLDLHPSVNDALKSIDTAKHVSPQELHFLIEQAAAISSNNYNKYDNYGNTNNSNTTTTVDSDDHCTNTTILLDVRNMYETRIGKFQYDGIETVDPLTRNYSEFAKYVDDNIDKLRNKKVLAYCTGGVRCEKASKYLKYKGIQNIYQLHGGIHAYMEAFPDGGIFHGKNFVYDPRIAVPYPNSSSTVNEVIGHCLLCDVQYDDYTMQFRCQSCRMLVLICDHCSIKIINTTTTTYNNNNTHINNNNKYLDSTVIQCENCASTLKT